MSQRDSGFKRIENDAYETPAWVTAALIPHLPAPPLRIWEPACGSGQMVKVLYDQGYEVVGTDIDNGTDFLKVRTVFAGYAIVTNPPYTLAKEFIELSLSLTSEKKGMVAMLLRTDFDHAKTRKRLFADHPAFAKKLVLTKRIRWIEGSTGSPSFNHAWMIWDWEHKGPPVLAYD